VSSAALEERTQIGCKRKGRVDFALFNIPRIAKSLMPVDNERKHGGVAEPIRRLWQVITTKRRNGQLNFAISVWKKCADRLLSTAVLKFLIFGLST
jgi:hypothetical protein